LLQGKKDKNLRITLDHNCLIAIENDPEGKSSKVVALAKLITLYKFGSIDIAFCGISASERLPQNPPHNYVEPYFTKFDEYRKRLTKIGLEDIPIIQPIGYWDITFWDQSTWADDSIANLGKVIYGILFEEAEFEWLQYALNHDISPEDTDSKGYKNWRNHTCDALGLLAHIQYERDMFVTDDGNFFKLTKKPKLLDLGAKSIEWPEDALEIITRNVADTLI
jgi:hypothetical protein